MNALPASAVILCGGCSSRMGRDKAALPFGAETLLDRVARIVSTEVDEIVIAAARGQQVATGYRVVHDSTDGAGPAWALVDALSQVRHPRAFVVACDTPLLAPGVIETLLELSRGWEACVPVVEGLQMTTCAVYETAAVLGLFQVRVEKAASLQGLVAGLRTRFVQPDELRAVDPALHSFLPCNTPEEYANALTLAGLSG